MRAGRSASARLPSLRGVVRIGLKSRSVRLQIEVD